jgi:hypothetical protein
VSRRREQSALKKPTTRRSQFHDGRGRSQRSSHTFDIDMSTRDAWSWLATGRYGVRPAPNGLALVQDFLNTRASTLTGPDMLCDNVNANAWAAHAVRAWSAQRGAVCEPPTLTAHDADKLRDVRNTLDSTLAAVPAVGARHALGPAEFTITYSSELLWTPRGRGWQWYYGAILCEILLSQHAGTWRRLKQCRNVECRSTFYDSSWNNGASWHNRRICDPAFTNRVAQQT